MTLLRSLGKPTAIIVTEFDDLSLSLVKKLLEKNFKIFLLTKKINSWKKYTGLFGESNVDILKIKDLREIERADYLIYHYNFYKTLSKTPGGAVKEIRREIGKIDKELPPGRHKNLFIIPALNGLYMRELTQKGKALYFSETIGEGAVLDARLVTFALLKQGRENSRSLPKNSGEIRPMSATSAAEKIVRFLFSFSFPNQATLLGEAISPEKLLPPGAKEGERDSRKRKHYKYPKYFSVGQLMIEDKIKDPQGLISESAERPKSPGPEKKKRRIIKHALWLMFILIVSPIILTGASATGLVVAYKSIGQGKTRLAEKAIKASYVFAAVSQKELGLFSSIPVAKNLLSPLGSASEILKRLSDMGIRGVSVLKKAEELTKSFFGDKSYKVSPYSEKIALDLEYIYKESGFILGEIDADPFLSTVVARKTVIQDLIKKRENLLYLSRIMDKLPVLLGEGQKRKYLVLLQNNMELRPTGGYVGSFSLVTIEGGRLSDFVVWDVFEADGQLRGHVEPPAPIKNYLGEGGWYLRDSNWDPDFTVSAARAEWFLDKEINEKVDGAFGFDLEFIKSLLKITGPVHLSDFDKNIDSANLFQAAREEIESNYFPGSTKKASLLNGLSKVLYDKVKDVKENRTAVGKVIYENLEEKHIQAYLKEPGLSAALEKLGWDGGVVINSDCGDNCYNDYFGVVEANLGVNKANFYVERELSTQIKMGEGSVQKKLMVTIKNNAGKETGLKGRYKTYIRLLVPKEGVLNKIELIKGGSRSELKPETWRLSDRLEIGALVTIEPQEAGAVIFSWATPVNLNFGKKGSYRLFIRKQAGTLEDSLGVSFVFPSALKLQADPALGLTREGSSGYNTTLARDFVSRISW